MENLRALAQAYLQVLPTNCRISGLRVSDIAIRGDVLPDPAEGMRGLNPNLLGGNDGGLLIRFVLPGGYVVRYIMKGLADDYESSVQETGDPILSEEGKQKWTTFLNTIAALQFQFRVNRRVSEENQTNIKSIRLDKTVSSYTLTTDTNNVEVGTTIFIGGKGAKAWPVLRGEQEVFDVEEGKLVVSAPIPCGQQTYRGGLRYFIRGYEYLSPLEEGGWSFQGFSSRKSGRPFGVRRGRSVQKKVLCVSVPVE